MNPREATERIEELASDRNLFKSLYDQLAREWDKIEQQLEALATKWDADYHTCTDGEQGTECAAELRRMFGLKERANRVHCDQHKTSWLRSAVDGCLVCRLERQLHALRRAATTLADRWQDNTDPGAKACAKDLRALFYNQGGHRDELEDSKLQAVR